MTFRFHRCYLALEVSRVCESFVPGGEESLRGRLGDLV